MNGTVYAVLITVLGCFVMAGAQITGKMAADRVPLFRMCALRFGLAIPVGYAAYIANTGRFRLGFTLPQCIIFALIGVLSWGIGASLFFLITHRDGIHRAAPICNSMTVWVVALSVIFLKEPLFPALGVVVVLLLTGIILMTPAAKEQKHWSPAIPLAVVVSLVWAVTIVLSKVFLKGVDPSAFVCVKVIGATLFLSLIAPFSKGPVLRGGLALTALSGACLAGGDILLMVGVKALHASVFSPLYATTIPIGFLLSIFILKEKPVPRNWFGMALIFIAAAVCGYYGAK